MRRLYLLRHAKSSWDDPRLPDADRPLAPRGQKAARRLARYLEAEQIVPELVLCSPAARARQTLERISTAIPATTRIELEQRLYGAGDSELYAVIRSVPADVASLMLVGHNPGLQSLAISLARAGHDLDRLEAKFPTGALAVLTSEVAWTEFASGAAELERLVVPRELV